MFALGRRVVSASTSATFARTMAQLAAGARIPSVALGENTPATSVDIAALCAGKRVVIFGVPGAFAGTSPRARARALAAARCRPLPSASARFRPLPPASASFRPLPARFRLRPFPLI